MGSQGETNAQKRHYNISMSKRTRKPQNPEKENSMEKHEHCTSRERNNDHQQQKSLKQLIEGRCSLAQHFREEEKEQRLVVRPPEDGFGGLRLKRSTVRNFSDILSHLIKVKRESYTRSWRKPAFSFKLIEHK